MNTYWNRNTPIDRQLRDQAAALILEGSLRPGDALPDVGRTAADVSVNPLIVERAYRQLVAEELVEQGADTGMIVAKGARERIRRMERERFVREIWPSIRESMECLGLDLPTLVRADAVN